MDEEKVVPPAEFLDQMRTALTEAGKSVEETAEKLTALRLVLVANRNKPYRDHLRSDPAVMRLLGSFGYTGGLFKVVRDLDAEVQNLASGKPTVGEQEFAKEEARKRGNRERYQERKSQAAQTKAIEQENDEIRARLRAEAGLPPE